MKHILLAGLLSAVSVNAFADKWVYLPGYTLFELVNGGSDEYDPLAKAAREQGTPRSAQVVGVNSIPSGGDSFLLVTTVELLQGKQKYFFRCFEKHLTSMEREWQKCYELRRDTLD